MENEWISWEGGECPVDPNAIVDIEIRNSRRSEILENQRAGDWGWTHDTLAWITAYRVKKD